MQYYALTWNPHSDNIGHDLTALAATQLLPRVDRVISAEALDMPLPDYAPEDRLITLMCSHCLTRADHWPPAAPIAPVCLGVHISQQDPCGVDIGTLDGAGLEALKRVSPIAVRDLRTARRLEQLGVPHTVTGDITLLLHHEDVPRMGVVCCDAPDEVTEAIHRFRPDVTCVTHDQPDPNPDFAVRMAAAQAMVDLYAGAEMVFTRRLHCAMVCVALGTPVLLLYHPEYEDVGRFAPMNGMVRHQNVADFLRETVLHGLPAPWRNPVDLGAIQRDMRVALHDAMTRAAQLPLPLVPEAEARTWRRERTEQMLTTAARTITRLENAHYALLHEKFERLAQEDAIKAALADLLSQPEVVEGLRAVSLRQQLAALTPKERKALRSLHKQGLADVDDLTDRARELLSRLGWPENAPQDD